MLFSTFFNFLCTENVLKSDPKAEVLMAVFIISLFHIELLNSRVQMAPLQATTTINNEQIILNRICIF